MREVKLTLNGCLACRDYGKPMYDESEHEIECENCGLRLKRSYMMSVEALFEIWNRPTQDEFANCNCHRQDFEDCRNCTIREE